jgi:hypothetical protein
VLGTVASAELAERLSGRVIRGAALRPDRRGCAPPIEGGGMSPHKIESNVVERHLARIGLSAWACTVIGTARHLHGNLGGKPGRALQVLISELRPGRRKRGA